MRGDRKVVKMVIWNQFRVSVIRSCTSGDVGMLLVIIQALVVRCDGWVVALQIRGGGGGGVVFDWVRVGMVVGEVAPWWRVLRLAIIEDLGVEPVVIGVVDDRLQPPVRQLNL